MIGEVARLFRRRPDFAIVSLAGALSATGCGLTQVAVYGALNAEGAGVSSFAAAFAFSVLPGIFTSRLGAALAHRWPGARLLVVLEVAGAAALVAPWLGIVRHETAYLFAAQLLASALAGLAVPVGARLTRSMLKSDDLAAAAAVSNYSFSANVLIGTGLGTLLYPYCAPTSYLAIDLATYLAAAALIVLLGARIPAARHDDSAPPPRFRWGALSATQKRAFLMLPLLTVVGAPATAILPGFGSRFGAELGFSGLTFAPALVLLLAKTLGQMIGPTLVSSSRLERALSSDSLLAACMAGFLALYGGIAFSGSLVLTFALALIAHAMSNVVFICGYYSLSRSFDEREISFAAAAQYQLQALIIVVASFAAGKAADSFSPAWIPLVSAVVLGAIVVTGRRR